MSRQAILNQVSVIWELTKFEGTVQSLHKTENNAELQMHTTGTHKMGAAVLEDLCCTACVRSGNIFVKADTFVLL